MLIFTTIPELPSVRVDLEEIEIEGDSGKTETWNPQSEDGGADGWS